MVGLIAKTTAKVGVWAILTVILLNTFMDLLFPFLDFLLSGSLLQVFRAIDYFIPLPFTLICLSAYLSMRYFWIMWFFVNWIYKMIFM